MNIKTITKLAGLLILLISIESCYPQSPQQTDIAWSDNLADIDRYKTMIDSTLLYLENQGSRYGIDRADQFQIIDQKSKQEIVAVSSRILDCLAHLDFIRYANQGFYYQLPGEIHYESFINYYTAFLVQSSRAVNFINIINRNKALFTILDEAYPEYGLQENSFTEFKSHFLSPKQALEYSALKLIYRNKRPDIDPYYTRIALLEDCNSSLGFDYGIKLSIQHAQDVIGNESFLLWFPIQKNVAEWMGTIYLFREGKHLISSKDIEDIQKQLIPGDILFQRREWNLSNAGIPGYWTHAAFFVGDSIERSQFANDDSIRSWVKTMGIASGSFEELLKATYPIAYENNVRHDSSQQAHTVLEALSPGVIFQTLKISLTCDGVGVLRPRLTELGKAQSIYKSFQYYGRAYDYNFDFLTDSTLVCSELIYKSFESSNSFVGIQFNTVEIAGRIMASANQMVKQFDREHDTINLDFVLFFDGNELESYSTPKSEDVFRTTWRRLDIFPIISSEVLMLSPDNKN